MKKNLAPASAVILSDEEINARHQKERTRLKEGGKAREAKAHEQASEMQERIELQMKRQDEYSAGRSKGGLGTKEQQELGRKRGLG